MEKKQLKLILCQGLPASGKSTFALELSTKMSWGVVCKDNIREGLVISSGGKWAWSPENEKKDVEPKRDQEIEFFLKNGISCISADTNLAPKHVARLTGLATKYGADVVMKRFETPLWTCIQRDKARIGDKQVGEEVIRRMAAQYPWILGEPEVIPVEFDESLPKAIICDLDGTIAFYQKQGLRGHYDTAKCMTDVPNQAIIDILNNYNGHVIYLTGRDDKFRKLTNDWLDKVEAPSGLLLMRDNLDKRSGWQCKLDIFNRFVRGKYNVELCFEDLEPVVRMWEKLGLTVLQVRDGLD